MKSFDVILFDAVGVPFSGHSPECNGLGGSEFEQILLAEELVRQGVRVACMNRLPSWCRIRGVEYLPIETMEWENFECEALVLMRTTPCPQDIKHKRLVRWVTDHGGVYPDDGAWIIGVSRWQIEQMTGGVHREEYAWVHNMLPDWVYNLKQNRNTKEHSFIYASAAVKGLRETLMFFESMKKTKEFSKATLKVLNPGYDSLEVPKIDGVTYLGALPFHRVVEEMQTCRSLLHVSTFKETFGIVHALAELLGLNVFVWQSQGRDALSESCNTKLITDSQETFNQNMTIHGKDPQHFKPVKAYDYRASTLIKKWLSILKFSGNSAGKADTGEVKAAGSFTGETVSPASAIG